MCAVLDPYQIRHLSPHASGRIIDVASLRSFVQQKTSPNPNDDDDAAIVNCTKLESLVSPKLSLQIYAQHDRKSPGMAEADDEKR